MDAFRVKWPTPAESMTNLRHNKTSQDCNNTQKQQSQIEGSMDISFLQPSVVYQSPKPDIHGRLFHSILDIGGDVDIPLPNPNMHIWSGTLDEVMTVGKDMHPAILSQLKPCKTKGNNNCLYNAVCLCLGMPESHQDILREKTALCLQKHAGHFEQLLKASDEISLQTLIEQCRRPFRFEGWGNEFHILALAIMLRRNIIVYTTFKNPKGQFYQRKNKNIVGLAEEFRIGGEKIGQHSNFEPQKGITCHNPIFLQLNGSHFTALLPRLLNPIYCIPPATNLPSIPNNGIQLNIQGSSVGCMKMSRQARWRASKTPAQLAEYKEREKAKRKQKKATSDKEKLINTEEMVQKKSKLINQKHPVQSNAEWNSVKKMSAVQQGERNTTAVTNTSQIKAMEHNQISNMSGKRKSAEQRSEENKRYYKKKKEAEKCDMNGKSTCGVKLSKSERNRLYYAKNKERIKQARLKDPVKHQSILAARREAYNDPVKHAAELADKKAAYADPEKRKSKAATRLTKNKDPVRHKSLLAARREAYKDPVKHAIELAKKKVAYADPEKRKRKSAARLRKHKDLVRHKLLLAARREAYKDPVKHAVELAKRKAAYADPEKRKIKLKARKEYSTMASSDYAVLLSKARKAMLELPALACTVCYRARFREQVKLCHRNKYPQSQEVLRCFTGKYIHKCEPDCKDSSVYHEKKKSEWICYTCHRHLLKGDMPPQAAVNNLWLDDIPQELEKLNALEMHLVSIVQPFMKIVPLPRGAQKGVRGQMVCVPANLQRTADSLPWTLNTNNLIRVKLKRKQEYKGHHLFMMVSQKRVMAALKKLMEINPAYTGKNISFRPFLSMG